MLSDLEKKNNELSIENIKIKQEANGYKEKYDKIIIYVQDIQIQVNKAIDEREKTIENLGKELTEANEMIGSLQTSNLSMKNKISLLEYELEKSKAEADDLSKQVSEGFVRQNEYNLAFDEISNEMLELKSRFMSKEEEIKLTKLEYDNLIEELKMKIDGLESEKVKLEEEHENAYFVHGITSKQLEEKKQQISEFQRKVIILNFVTISCKRF